MVAATEGNLLETKYQNPKQATSQRSLRNSTHNGPKNYWKQIPTTQVINLQNYPRFQSENHHTAAINTNFTLNEASTLISNVANVFPTKFP